MSLRIAPVLAASLAVAVLAAACASWVGAPAAEPSVPLSPAPSVAPEPGRPEPSTRTPSPNAGDVEEGTAPLLSIELESPDAIRATLEDRAARAWRIVVEGVGERAGDRLELVVETADVGPSIQAIEIEAGEVVDVMDLSSFADGTAVAGGCHRTLPVCVDSAAFHVPEAGDGTFSVRLTLPEPGTPLRITGATAAWPGEPFVLGPWTETEAFPWGG
jgi:hypothetical protein